MPLKADEASLENISLSEKVFELLKEAIIQGNLGPGEKLDIFELAEKFRISRTPIKDAFNRLNLLGLVTIYPNRGTFVRGLPEPKEVKEFFDARLMFELWGAEGVCGDSIRIDQMQEGIHQCDRLFQTGEFDYAEFFRRDTDFHRTIVDGAKNSEVSKMYDLLA